MHLAMGLTGSLAEVLGGGRLLDTGRLLKRGVKKNEISRER